MTPPPDDSDDAEADDDLDLTRREFASSAGLALVAPLSISPNTSNALTPLASQFARAQTGWVPASFGLTPKKYGGHPAWPISAADGDLDSLLNWADSNDYEVIHQHEGTDTATVAAPIEAVVGRTFDAGLVDTDYVEQVDLDVSVSNVEPPQLPLSEDAHPTFGTLQQVFMSSAPAPTGGLAFDAEEVTHADALDTINDTDVAETGTGYTLGVIDTGLNYDSDYVGDRVLDASSNLTAAEKPTVGADGTAAVADGNSHGTWVTTAAAGSPPDTEYEGVAPGADILSLKALDDEGSGATATIAHAVRYGTDEGADLLCMSLGSPFYSQDLADAIEYATENGVLVVVAAGNDRAVTRFVNYPAADPNTLAVSATTTGTPADVKSASFANVGPSPGTTDFSQGATTDAEVGIAAPGMALEASLPSGMSVKSGTSMAAPYVAGAALAVLEADGSLQGDPEALRERLEMSAAPAKNLAAAEAAHGLLDVEAAVEGATPEDEQSEVMTSEASARDSGYRAESAARGGLLARYVF